MNYSIGYISRVEDWDDKCGGTARWFRNMHLNLGWIRSSSELGERVSECK
jgi:hypothetical protein